MKKSNSKRRKNVTDKKAEKGVKKSSKKRVESSLRNSKQRDSSREEKGKSNSKNKNVISKNKIRAKTSRVKKDDELELLNSLFLKELQKNDKGRDKNKTRSNAKVSRSKISNKKSNKAALKFERKPNKENKRLKGNVFVIIFPPKSSFQQKINLINNWDGKELKYYVNRFSKLPQAVQIILTTKKRKDTFERATRISSFDFVVNIINTKKLILEMMLGFQENYIEYVESEEPLNSDWVYDPSKIIKVTVRFIY